MALLRKAVIAGPTARPDQLDRLSERELAVARLIGQARSNTEIAAELFISLSTVKGHVASIQTKLGARNRVAVSIWAWENGLVERR
jgi:DNA-binding NarL/FixJ family response regulator